MAELTGDGVRELFGAIAERYAQATRMARELQHRLHGLDGEREQWLQAFTDPSVTARARLELKEIEELRPRVERSARTWSEKARALELIAGSCLAEAARHPYRRRRAAPVAPASGIAMLPALPPPLWPDGRPDGRPDVRPSDAEGMSADAPLARE